MKHYRNQNNETQIIDEESYLAINGASRLNIGNAALHKNIPGGKQRKQNFYRSE
jgi:hypothetical protein